MTGVKVETGKITEVNVVMEESATGIEEVVVFAVRRMNSEVSLLANMRTSNVVMSGVSAQQITRTQDRDASKENVRLPTGVESSFAAKHATIKVRCLSKAVLTLSTVVMMTTTIPA